MNKKEMLFQTKEMPGWLKEETRRKQEELKNLPSLLAELVMRIFAL